MRITGSTMAMATNASAAGTDTSPGPDPNLAATEQSLGTSQDEPLSGRSDSAMARRNSVEAVVQPAASKPPTISTGGMVPLYDSSNAIQPGEWVSIFGANLASGTAVWKGDFPTSLGGTSVLINGKAAYLSMVSPGKSTSSSGRYGSRQSVCSRYHSAGKATSTVTLSLLSPAFELRDARHVSAIIVRSDGRELSLKGRTISWDPPGPASAILRWARRQATWWKFSASGSGRLPLQFRPEKCIQAPRR